MMHLYPNIELSQRMGGSIRLRGDPITVHQYAAVYAFDGTGPVWFQYHDGKYTRMSTVPSVFDSNVSVCTMDPITAVILKLVTPEEIRMPGGLAGLLALIRSV